MSSGMRLSLANGKGFAYVKQLHWALDDGEASMLIGWGNKAKRKVMVTDELLEMVEKTLKIFIDITDIPSYEKDVMAELCMTPHAFIAFSPGTVWVQNGFIEGNVTDSGVETLKHHFAELSNGIIVNPAHVELVETRRGRTFVSFYGGQPSGLYVSMTPEKVSEALEEWRTRRKEERESEKEERRADYNARVALGDLDRKDD